MATSVTLNNGVVMPIVLYGSFKVKGFETVKMAIDAALGCGYRGIDTASVYGNETDIGEALNGTLYKKYNLKREDLFITSKLAPGDQGYEAATAALDRSLACLNTPYLDLYLIHWPGSSGVSLTDPSSAAIFRERRAGSWKALEEALSQGKVRSIGVSNYMPSHLREMDSYAKVPPAVLQIEHHPLLNQSEVIAECKARKIHYQAYSSLGTTDHHIDLVEHPVITGVAASTKHTAGQVLLKWAVQQNISVLPKSTNPLHIRENIDLFSDWTLTEDQMASISSLNAGKHYCWDPNTIS